ncbi:MAG: sodium:proton antiporter [Bacteroidetes bacterium]|nr:sodium:proton antiporter [Bacteroidota bacterium]
MTTTIIIAFCSLLLLAYLFDLSASKTKIPAVILLLLLGWGMQQLASWMQLQLPDFSSMLPVLGTVGLVLIVLEGSLELEWNPSQVSLIRKSLWGAVIPIFALAALLALAFWYVGRVDFKVALLNAIPLCVISSAIAIPSVRNLSSGNKAFVIYESSLSDIFGVLVFNFLALNKTIDAMAFGTFAGELVLIGVVSVLATVGLAFLLNRIEHHIKYVPIILLVVLIYAVSKVYHLFGLVFILFFGLFIGNLQALKRFDWLQKFKPDELSVEVKKFKELTGEAAFLIRALFFLLFGFLIDTSAVLNVETLVWAASIVGLILVVRIVQLRLSNLPLLPLLFIAPRGLITILLFLSIEPGQTIPLVNPSLIIQVILLTALLMMGGMMMAKKPAKENNT